MKPCGQIKENDPDYKRCVHCGNAMRRSRRETRKYWRTKRYCSMTCSRRARPDKPFFGSLQRRFDESYSVDPHTGCWLWQKLIDPYGYARMQVGIEQKAHRVSWVLHRGPIPEGLHVDHLCFVRHCVNPDHLEPVTALENNRRMRARQAARAILVGEG